LGLNPQASANPKPSNPKP